MFDINALLRLQVEKEINADGLKPVYVMPLDDDGLLLVNSATGNSEKLLVAATYGLKLDGKRAIEVSGLTEKGVIEALTHEDAPVGTVNLIGATVLELSGLDVPELDDEDETDLSDDGLKAMDASGAYSA